jgi:hypothetical protein
MTETACFFFMYANLARLSPEFEERFPGIHRNRRVRRMQLDARKQKYGAPLEGDDFIVGCRPPRITLASSIRKKVGRFLSWRADG